MNVIHHFGDSYGMQLYDLNRKKKVTHFVNHIANFIGYDYRCEAFGGKSNEQILDIIIRSLHHMKRGDIVFVNFSFFVRGCWYDNQNKKVSSTNIFYNEIDSHNLLERTSNDKIISLVTYYLNHTDDYAFRVFTLINSLFEYLISIGINIFYIYVDGDKISDNLLKVGTNIKFENGFGQWLKKYGFHKEQNGHYTEGIQHGLANAIINKTNGFGTSYSKKVEITIDDIDLNSIVKTHKSLL